MKSDALIDVLLADGPDPELAERLMLFGQFVGSWDLTVTDMPIGGPVTSGTAELHVGWALEGRAVIDVWLFPGRSARGTSRPPYSGTTIRFYDPAIDAWRSTWIAPPKGLVMPFIGRQVGDEIVLEGSFTEGARTRWIFSEITPQRFRWRAEESRDGGTWTMVEEMIATRTPPAAIA